MTPVGYLVPNACPHCGGSVFVGYKGIKRRFKCLRCKATGYMEVDTEVAK